jgi:hypothetical protein
MDFSNQSPNGDFLLRGTFAGRECNVSRRGYIAISAQNFTAPIAALQPPSNYQDCVFFTFVGIPQADPIVPNNPWFALSQTQIG